LSAARQWFFRTPERALDQAYDAALMIKAIEDEHFDGQPIAPRVKSHGDNVDAYFQAELRKCLSTARVRLAEFRASRLFINLSENAPTSMGRTGAVPPPEGWFAERSRDRPAIILEKLQFIDGVLDRYSSAKIMTVETRAAGKDDPASRSLVPVSTSIQLGADQSVSSYGVAPTQRDSASGQGDRNGGVSSKTSFLPRSILRTINRLRRELNPQAEAEVVQSFRSSKAKTIISLRFVLLIVLVPLLTQQIAKNFFVGPLVDQLRPPEEQVLFLNPQMEAEALEELKSYEERLRFSSLIAGLTQAPKLTDIQIEESLEEKAIEIAESFRTRSSSAIKNVFADLLSIASFVVVVMSSQREIAIVKSFMDDIVYGLSDSAKAFIIILFTDIFVGFHSPHGWEVILEGLSRHLGLPESREFIFLFIATFPVILDTIFKYWIFRYLNRISPSAVATYRNMNE